MKMVFIASIIRNELCILYAFFDNFFKNDFCLIAAINFTTRDPLYTCLVKLIFTYFNLLPFPKLLISGELLTPIY